MNVKKKKSLNFSIGKTLARELMDFFHVDRHNGMLTCHLSQIERRFFQHTIDQSAEVL